MASKIDAAITSFMIDWKLLKFTFPGETKFVFFARTCSLARVWSLARQERKKRINQTRLHLRGSVHGCNMDAVFMIRNNWIIKAGTFLRWNDKSRQLDTLGVQLGSQLASNQFARSLK